VPNPCECRVGTTGQTYPVRAFGFSRLTSHELAYASLWPFRNVLRRMRVVVRWPDRTRRRRISIAPNHRRSIVGAGPAAAAAAAGTTATAAHAAHRQPCAGPESSSVFFVEDIECRQADVGDFLVTESDFVTRSRVLRQHVGNRRTTCCGCSARQCQRQPGRPQNRYGFASTLSLRGLLRVRHARISQRCGKYSTDR
jgi:hypothetical protein